MTSHPQLNNSDDVHIIQPSFTLQRKVGGSATRLLNPTALKRAEVALEAVIPPLNQEVERLLRELELAVGKDGKGASIVSARDVIWKNAHEIRGLAGTAGKKSLGLAADIICRYLNGTANDFTADPTVLSTICVVATQALKDGADEDPMVTMLLTNSARAVVVQRNREGRGDPE
jgi:hypothetical protein